MARRCAQTLLYARCRVLFGASPLPLASGMARHELHRKQRRSGKSLFPESGTLPLSSLSISTNNWLSLSLPRIPPSNSPTRGPHRPIAMPGKHPNAAIGKPIRLTGTVVYSGPPLLPSHMGGFWSDTAAHRLGRSAAESASPQRESPPVTAPDRSAPRRDPSASFVVHARHRMHGNTPGAPAGAAPCVGPALDQHAASPAGNTPVTRPRRPDPPIWEGLTKIHR